MVMNAVYTVNSLKSARQSNTDSKQSKIDHSYETARKSKFTLYSISSIDRTYRKYTSIKTHWSSVFSNYQSIPIRMCLELDKLP